MVRPRGAAVISIRDRVVGSAPFDGADTIRALVVEWGRERE
jgi:hypothetical protein